MQKRYNYFKKVAKIRMYVDEYQEAGVPIHDQYEMLNSKSHCAICLQKLKWWCKCPEPDFCELCFNFHRDAIIKLSAHGEHKTGVPVEITLDDR